MSAWLAKVQSKWGWALKTPPASFGVYRRPPRPNPLNLGGCPLPTTRSPNNNRGKNPNSTTCFYLTRSSISSAQIITIYPKNIRFKWPLGGCFWGFFYLKICAKNRTKISAEKRGGALFCYRVTVTVLFSIGGGELAWDHYTCIYVYFYYIKYI